MGFIATASKFFFFWLMIMLSMFAMLSFGMMSVSWRDRGGRALHSMRRRGPGPLDGRAAGFGHDGEQ